MERQMTQASRSAAPGRTNDGPDRVDVVVVGAGFAGLVAARSLAAAGRSVLVLEARDRVGGRVLNRRVADTVVELGGEFVGPTQDHLLALAEEVGVATYPSYADGQLVTYFGDKRVVGSLTDDKVAADYEQLVAGLQELADTIDVNEPWAAPDARALDSQTVAGWLHERAATTEAVGMISASAHVLWGKELSELSLLFVAWYIAAAGNEDHPGTYQRLTGVRGGAQERRFLGGSQEIALRVAAELAPAVVLSAPVRALRQVAGGVTVAADGRTVTADRVIVSVPPPLAAQISYDPPLPATRTQLLQRWSMGALAKSQVAYATPWWRLEQLSGETVSDRRPFDTTFDNTPSPGAPGVLLGFVGASNLRTWGPQPEAERRAAAIANFGSLFGPSPSPIVDYFEQDWSAEPWTLGGPTASMGPTVLTDNGPDIRAPFGRIHWAGTETATFWSGYIEGAVRSGERAAAEVLAEL